MYKKLLIPTVISLAVATAQAGDVDVASNLTTQSNSAISYELAAGAHSHYVWRGIDQGGGQLVDTSLTAAKTIAGVDVSLNLWHATTGNGGLDELDVTLGLEKEIAGTTYGLGVIEYFFPDASGLNTTEVYVSASRELFAGITGSLAIYKDVDAGTYQRGYGEVGLERDLAFFGDSFVPTLGLLAGYNFDTERFTHYQATLSTSFDLGKGATVNPYLSYSQADENARDEFFGGASIAISF